jgi:hypothetical protein
VVVVEEANTTGTNTVVEVEAVEEQAAVVATREDPTRNSPWPLEEMEEPTTI